MTFEGDIPAKSRTHSKFRACGKRKIVSTVMREEYPHTKDTHVFFWELAEGEAAKERGLAARACVAWAV